MYSSTTKTIYTIFILCITIISKSNSIICCDTTKESCVPQCKSESSGFYTSCVDMTTLCNGTLCSDCGSQYEEYSFGCKTKPNWTCNTNCYSLTTQGTSDISCTNFFNHNSTCDFICDKPGFIHENISKTCTNGKWSNTKTCTFIDNYCLDNVTIPNGVIIFSGNKIGSEAFISCSNQIAFTSICSNGSKWIPSLNCNALYTSNNTLKPTIISQENNSLLFLIIALIIPFIIMLVVVTIILCMLKHNKLIKKRKNENDIIQSQQQQYHSSYTEEESTEENPHTVIYTHFDQIESTKEETQYHEFNKIE